MRLQDIVDLGGTQEDIDFMKDVLTDDEQVFYFFDLHLDSRKKISTATASQNPKTKPIKECVVKEKIDVQVRIIYIYI